MSAVATPESVKTTPESGGLLSFIGNIPISLKLILLLIVPLLTMVYFTQSQVRNAQALVTENTEISDLAEFSVNASALVHELQKERGMSSGYIGASGNKFINELAAQHKLTDGKIAQLKEYLQNFTASNYSEDFNKQLNDALTSLDDIPEKRKNILALQLTLNETLGFYTKKLITVLLNLVATLPELSSNGQISVQGNAYSNFLQSKERAGIERAVLSNTFAQNQFGPGVFNKFFSLVVIQDTYMHEFLRYATEEQKTFYNSMMDNQAVKEAVRLRALANSKAIEGGFDVDPIYWWDMQTKKINLLKQVEDKLSFELIAAADKIVTDSNTQLQNTLLLTAGSFIIIFIIAFLITRNMTGSISQLTGTVNRVEQGNTDARSGLTNKDELGLLSQALDSLLDERLSQLMLREKEAEQLNESIIVLLQAVAKLSQNDLTSTIPVREDITGAVADALNQFSTEASLVLNKVTEISSQVNDAAVNSQGLSNQVLEASQYDLQQVEQTVKDLVAMANTMREMASEAQTVNTASENAIETTNSALDTVTDTVNSIMNIRDTIRETEKRIKRLGERSQEIGGTVNLINNIAERTHILSLNASMHAASAGEAGRSFMVVADEIQKLSENSREATAQIETLVKNIQSETTDTAATMNTVITQVVDGSSLAEEAGKKMQQTKQATELLVTSVKHISESSMSQAQASDILSQRAEQVQKSVEKTSQQMNEQTVENDQLVSYAKNLQDAVNVFTLPQNA